MVVLNQWQYFSFCAWWSTVCMACLWLCSVLVSMLCRCIVASACYVWPYSGTNLRCVVMIYLAWEGLVRCNNFSIVMLLSSCPYSVLVMLGGLDGLCCWVLHSGIDLICVVGILLSWEVFVHFNCLPSLCCLPLSRCHVGAALLACWPLSWDASFRHWFAVCGWLCVVFGSVVHSGCSCIVVPLSSYYCAILVMLVAAVVVILGSHVNHCEQM